MSSLLEAMWSRWQRSASATLTNLWSRPVGQALLRHADRLLWILEKAHYWSVPPNPDKPPLASNELTRPLPWIIFLPLLAVLRLSREAASFAALLLGKEPIRPADIVKFIQQRRRAVRALKYQGTRAMRARAHNSRQIQKRSLLRQLTRPLEATIRIVTGGLLFSPQLLKVHHDHSDRADNNNSHKRIDTEENLLEKLLQNADLSDNTSTDDSTFTLKNATDSDGDSSSSENPSFATAESVTAQRDEQSGSCTSSPIKDVEPESNKTFTVSEEDDDNLQNEKQADNEANTKEELTELTANKTDFIDQDSTILHEQPADIIKIVNDILNSEREVSTIEIKKPDAKLSQKSPKGSQNSNTKKANGEAKKPKDFKTKDTPSKTTRTSSVPIVNVTLADDEPTEESSPTGDGGGSREGSYCNENINQPKHQEKKKQESSSKKSPHSKDTKKIPTSIQTKKQSPTSAVQSAEPNSKSKKSFWKRNKSLQ